ncbi:hypothetical protein [Mucilaginibacter flavidus]|uniref:hypothetical protein n=1 Tax=Mucilaginibacter flavidus TaxID=2949309 RepID=UPI0020938DD8|nr:hypothetical protein [Mucilaginibacter flavidus]MCO5947848.1 hypothetical protein [Mucilaginibacter flavidus]
MINITVSQNDNTNLSFSAFEQYQLPAPLSGVDAEINNDLILKFEDEEEAIIYAAQLENLSNELNDKNTPQYVAISDIIMAIRNDEFVQSYTR